MQVKWRSVKDNCCSWNNTFSSKLSDTDAVKVLCCDDNCDYSWWITHVVDGGGKEWQPFSAGSQAAVLPFAFVAPLLLPVPVSHPAGCVLWEVLRVAEGFSASVAQCCYHWAAGRSTWCSFIWAVHGSCRWMKAIVCRSELWLLAQFALETILLWCLNFVLTWDCSKNTTVKQHSLRVYWWTGKPECFVVMLTSEENNGNGLMQQNPTTCCLYRAG